MGRYSNRNMKNNVHATLSTALSSIATTIQLTSGQGSRFGTDFPQIATLESVEGGKVVKREIVKITARSGDNLTVVRAFAPCPENDDANSQSQQSISFNADDTISMYITKEHFDKIADGFDNVDNSFDDVYENGTDELRTYKTTGLGIQVKPGKVMVGSSYYNFLGGTLTLTDNATNYIEIDEDGLLVSNTTGRNDENTKISIVTTSGGNVTNINNRRLGTVGGKIGGVNIHDLTEKIVLSPDDEFIIADSENIYQNKKVKYSNILSYSTIRLVTLGEPVTAGNGHGACYFGTDGKVYLSNVCGHNYCDGIVIDSGNTGDTVRMIISGFVPDTSLNGASKTVHLAYTSGTTDTGYGDYIQYVLKSSSSVDYSGVQISMNSKYSMLYPTGRGANIDKQFITPLFGETVTISTSGAGNGTVSSQVIHYATGLNGQFGNDMAYSISGCELGEKTYGGFMFNPKPRELIIGLGIYFIPSQTGIQYSNTVQAKYSGRKTYAMLTTNPTERYGQYSLIQESIDNTNRGTIAMSGYQSSTSDTDVLLFDFYVKAGRYYRVQHYHRSGTTWGGIFNNG